MKKTKIIYWTLTGLMGAALGVGSVFDAVSAPEAVAHVTRLGYPQYLVPFLGVAKLAAIVAILIPGFPRLKEWAYAGLVIDLVGAFYSHVTVGDGPEMWGGILGLLAVVTGSYLFYHKLRKAEAKNALPENAVPESKSLRQVSFSGS
jgi:hypothetical protein